MRFLNTVGALPMLLSLLVDLFQIRDKFQSAMAMFSIFWFITNCSDEERVWTVWTTCMQCSYLSPYVIMSKFRFIWSSWIHFNLCVKFSVDSSNRLFTLCKRGSINLSCDWFWDFSSLICDFWERLRDSLCTSNIEILVN